MNTTEHILLIILSSALAVFIVLAIVATIYIIKLVQSLRRIAQSAEGVVHSAESIAGALKHSATPVTIFNFVKHVVSAVQNAKGKK